jgi:hypothetical protein
MTLHDELETFAEELGTIGWRQKFVTDWTAEEHAAFRSWCEEKSKTPEGVQEMTAYFNRQLDRPICVLGPDDPEPADLAPGTPVVRLPDHASYVAVMEGRDESA